MEYLRRGSPEWRRRIVRVGVTLTSIAVVAFASVLLLPRGGAVEIPAGATVTPSAPTSTPTPDPIRLQAGARVLIFGDSYTAGYGADDPSTQGFAPDLVRYEPEWDISVEGVGSTGYLNAGNDGQGTFLQRLERLTSPDEFQLVILQGGSNDQNVENADMPQAVDATVQFIRQKFPSAQLLMLGPVSVSTNSNANKRYVDAVLRKYANDNTIAYVSPLQRVWFPTDKQEEWVNLAVGHPNTQGYDHMAQELAEALREFVTTA